MDRNETQTLKMCQQRFNLTPLDHAPPFDWI
jgi:hypothetical protein